MNYFAGIIIALSLYSCNGQNATANVEQKNPNLESFDNNNGIVYFSLDNGNTWKNTSNGIPNNVQIGLGGVATSENFLGVATKEYGVFSYNFDTNIWVNLPTEKQIIDNNIGSLIFHKNSIYVGTQQKGIFYTKDNGATWSTINSGLTNLTIRRFLTFENKLYVCTNGGFYSFNEKANTWKLEYGDAMQVNGATVFKGNFYIATSAGLFKSNTTNVWKNILPNHSLHNISSDDEQLYAMTYTELLLSSNDGITWKSEQEGLPQLYTFNVLNHSDLKLAGQWNGVYIKSNSDSHWKFSSNGLPPEFAVTNMKLYNDIIVISTSERKLKTGETLNK